MSSEHINTTNTKREIIEVAKELIACRTTEEYPSEIRKCIDYITDYFSDKEFHVKEYISKGKPMLWIAFNKKKRQKIILNCHIDIVDGHDSQFTAEVKDKKLFGRGASDMKGAVAILMHLMKHFSRMRNKPSLGLMIVADEEVGGVDGTKYLLKKGYKSEFCITGETSKGSIEVKHKGAMRLVVKAYGRSSHGSRPWLGTNAIDKLIKQYQKIIDEIPQAKNSTQWLPTINVTSFESKSPPNVTPSKAEMALDVRTTAEFDSKRVLQILRKHKIKYKKLLDASILDTSCRNKYVQALRKIAEKRLGKKVKLIKSAGGSDTRFFYQMKIPAVNFGPTGKGHHTGKEYLELDSVMPYYLTLHDFITKYG